MTTPVSILAVLSVSFMFGIEPAIGKAGGGVASQARASSQGAYSGTWTTSGLYQRLVGPLRLELTFAEGRWFELKRYEQAKLVSTVTIPYTVAAGGTLVVGRGADPYFTLTRSADKLQLAFIGRPGPARPLTRSVAIIWDSIGPTDIEFSPIIDAAKAPNAPGPNASAIRLDEATELCLRLLDDPANGEITSRLNALGQAAVAPMMVQLQALAKYWSTPDYMDRYAAQKAFSAAQYPDRTTGNDVFVLQVPPLSSDEVAVVLMALRLADRGIQEAAPVIRQVLAYNEPIRVRERKTMDLALARLAGK